MSQRVMIFGKRFAALRRDRYLTQEEFAQRLEMSPANIRRLEQLEVGGMQVKNFRRLAELLSVSPDALRSQIGASAVHVERMGLSANHDAGDDDALPVGLKPRTRREVDEVAHYHGVSAARIENRTDAARGRAPVPAGAARRFAVTVDGDCMEPRYHDGDVVVFSVDAAEREGIVDGKNYFIQFVDGQNTFKRMFLDPDDRERVILRCWNTIYPDRLVARKEIELLARAIYRLTPDE